MYQIPTIAVCDDDSSMNEQISELLRKYEQMHLEEISNFVFFSTAEKLLSYEASLDLLFLDIELNDASGVDLVPLIREKFPNITIIFISNHSKYYIHTARLSVFQFLVKPIDETIFFEELDRFFYRCHQRHVLYKIENKSGIIQFPIVEIMYISSSAHVLTIHHGTGNHKKRGLLSLEEKQLKIFNFIRCHQSYLINPRYIKEIKNYKVYLNNPYSDSIEELPISKNRAKEARAFYHSWLMQQKG